MYLLADGAARKDPEYRQYLHAQIQTSLSRSLANRSLKRRTVDLVNLFKRVVSADELFRLRHGLCVGPRNVIEILHIERS